jgi:hypothetical protein
MEKGVTRIIAIFTMKLTRILAIVIAKLTHIIANSAKK